VIDEITLTLPRDADFHRVAHLVLGGLAVRMDLTVENLEDLQIALDSILGPLPAHVLDEVEREQGSELSLRRVLESTVDDVQVDGDTVRLTKKVSAGAGKARG
jgi:hypothetical protein